MTHFWFRANLAFVLASVSGLDVFNLKRPRVGRLHKKSLKEEEVNEPQGDVNCGGDLPENDRRR